MFEVDENYPFLWQPKPAPAVVLPTGGVYWLAEQRGHMLPMHLPAPEGQLWHWGVAKRRESKRKSPPGFLHLSQRRAILVTVHKIITRSASSTTNRLSLTISLVFSFVWGVTVMALFSEQGHQTLCDQERWRRLVMIVPLLLGSRVCSC